MSDNKQVIHVKDLVIKADNVIIERSHRQGPFFGNRSNRSEESERNEQHVHGESREHNHEENSNERRPFWF